MRSCRFGVEEDALRVFEHGWGLLLEELISDGSTGDVMFGACLVPGFCRFAFTVEEVIVLSAGFDFFEFSFLTPEKKFNMELIKRTKTEITQFI